MRVPVAQLVWKVSALLLYFSLQEAAADCSDLNRIRAAASEHFRTIAGERQGRAGDVKSTLPIEGARCTISTQEDGKSPSHTCRWVLTQDQVQAKSVFEEMVAEVASCVRSREPPSRNDGRRKANVLFDDGAKRAIGVRYYFESGWYLMELEYNVFDE